MEPEAWVGEQVSVYLDARGSGENKGIGVLELIDDTGVVIQEDEEIIAYYPWRSILAIKVGEPEEPSRQRSIRGRRGRQIEGTEESRPTSGPKVPQGRAVDLKAPQGQAADPKALQDQVAGLKAPQGQSVGPKGPEDQEGVEGGIRCVLNAEITSKKDGHRTPREA